jgi:hypothetical protein
MALNQDSVSGPQYGAIVNPRHTASAGLSRKSPRGNFFENCPDLGSLFQYLSHVDQQNQ